MNIYRNGIKIDVRKNKICVDGKSLNQYENEIYVLLNKPRGYVSTVKDERGRKTVLELLNEIFPERIYPVGRLDLNSEGLMLLTNDGRLTNLLTHPRYEIEKTYQVKISGIITEKKLAGLRTGIKLEDGITAPAKVFWIKDDLIEITIHEGRNRQIRRMFAAIGCDVKRLRRVRLANLTLGNLRSGEFRELSKSELKELYRLAELVTKFEKSDSYRRRGSRNVGRN